MDNPNLSDDGGRTVETFNSESESGKPEGSAEQEEDSTPENASKAFEIILGKVGDFNFYQWKLMVICGVCGLFTACHNMGAVFLAASPDHWCDVPYFAHHNITLEKSLLNITAPWVRGKEGTLEHSKCQYYDFDYSSFMPDGQLPAILPSSETVSNGSMGLKSCERWVYDDEYFKSTIVTEWDLVCDKRWMMSSTQATYMMGILTGAVLFSAVSDKMGRRLSSLICCCLFFSASIAAAFANSFELFLVLRFIVAGAGQGMFLVNFILLMELVSLKGRNVLGNLFHIFFSIGFTSFSLLGYLVREWRDLQLVISVPSMILLGYYWLLPESPRWLLMQGREEEGLNVLKLIAKSNGRDFPSEEELKPLLVVIKDEVENKETKTLLEKGKDLINTVITLVRTPNMRKRNLIVFYTWFVTSMVYYGLTFSGANLNASVYVSVALSAAIEFPSTAFTILLLLKFGRRIILSFSFLVGGCSLLAIIFVPTEMVGLNLALATLGKYNLSSCFLLVFMFSAEMMPTHVRNISIGMASMFARIGSGLAPFIVDLLGDVYYAIPSTIFAVLALLAGGLSLLLPETMNRRLPESVAEVESLPR